VVGSIVSIALAVVTFFTASWIPLAIGAAVFVVVQPMHREPSSSRA
jgi:hypothetical protein